MIPPGTDRYALAAEAYLFAGYSLLDGAFAGKGEWMPDNQAEHDAMKNALSAWLRSRQSEDLPPGAAFTLAAVGYGARRFQRPNTQTRWRIWWLYLRAWWGNRSARAKLEKIRSYESRANHVIVGDPHLHAAICGQTGSGETYLAQMLAIGFPDLGIGVIVLHKPREPWRGVNWQTDNPELFIRKFWKCQNVVAFMEFDDARVQKMDTRFHDCFSQGRHNGIRCFFLSQRAAQMHPTVRENSSGLYLFSCGAKGAAVWAEEMCDDNLLNAASIPPRQFYYKPNRFSPAVLKTAGI